MKKILIVVDMQNDFIDGSLGSEAALLIVPKVKAAIEEAINDGTEIVFTRDTHYDNYMSTKEGSMLPVPHCIEGTDGHKISSELICYAEGRKTFDKKTFGSIELMNYVAEGGYDEIVLCGLCTDICVISNAMLIKAALPEADIKVLSDCTAGVSKETYDSALLIMNTCHIKTV